MSILLAPTVVFVMAALLGTAGVIGLIVGFNFTLGTRRKAGLRIITVCGSVLVALAISLVMYLLHE